MRNPLQRLLCAANLGMALASLGVCANPNVAGWWRFLFPLMAGLNGFLFWMVLTDEEWEQPERPEKEARP